MVKRSTALLKLKIIGLLTAFCTIVGPLWTHGESLDPGHLIRRLAEDGRDLEGLERLFRRPEVKLDPMVMVRKLTHKEAKLNYGIFLQPPRVERAYDYLREKESLLNEVRRMYGVPQELLVAILLVESDLGNHLGKRGVFNTLASMAAVRDFQQVLDLLPAEMRDSSGLGRARARFRRAWRWSYTELKALLDYSEKNSVDPLAIRGSIFGAFGLCQFIPTSALRYGVDWDGDGRVDLFQEGDALASMANYLRAHGWGHGLAEEGKRAVLLKYNRSRPYVDTILALERRIRDVKGPQGGSSMHNAPSP
jgi:membrane-bound lytic murein transglycosylase B